MKMSKVSCKLRNSFALDEKELYTWGSCQSGLLGASYQSDVGRLTSGKTLQIKYENKVYIPESVSAGHFHVAVVAKRTNTITPESLKSAKPLFEQLWTWFKKVFILRCGSPINFIRLILKTSEMSNKDIVYDNFYDLLIRPFIEYQKLHKKDIFNMEANYKKSLRDELEIAEEKIKFSHLELYKIFDSKDNKIIQLAKFAYNCCEHFKNYPDDFPFFVRLVMQFKEEITKEDCIKLFDYCYSEETKSNSATYEVEKNRAAAVYNELVKRYSSVNSLLMTDALIDVFLYTTQEVSTGFGAVFTWGVSSESRLGYITSHPNKSNSDKTENLNLNSDKNAISLKNANNLTSDALNEAEEVQIHPRMVIFKNVCTKIIKVSCGLAHTLALSDDKRIYAWGSGKFSCCGNANSDNVTTPALVDCEEGPFTGVTDIAAGMYFSMAVKDTRLYTWGCGSGGRLGHNDENSIGHPKEIDFFLNNDIKISQISAGDTHAAAISSEKVLFTWGNGNFGKLGHGNFSNLKVPVKVEFFDNKKVDKVVCGSHNSVAVLTDYRVFAWGKNAHGMLGVPHKVDQNILQPTEVALPRDDDDTYVAEIALGSMHSIFLLSNGNLLTCGNTVNGILAQPDAYDKVLVPTKIPDVKFFQRKHEDIFAKSDLFFGYNSDFSLKAEITKYPIKLKYAECSTNNTAFVTNTGDLYMTGEASLIPEDEEDSKETNENIANQVAAGKLNFNLEEEDYITKDKEEIVKTNEEDNYTLLGRESPNKENKKTSIEVNTRKYTPTITKNKKRKDVLKPFKITCNYLSEKVTQIAMSTYHVICVAEKAYSWGKNHFGVLGLANKSITDIVTQPTLIEKITSHVKMAAVSDSHSLVLTTNGEIYSFGSNLYGKLGLGNLDKYFKYKNTNDIPCELEPQPVRNVSFADYIACSNNHSACIMKVFDKEESRVVFTWGSGFTGKLGHPEKVDFSEPKRVEELVNKNEGCVNFVKVALGDEFTLALDIEGRLFGWGKRKYLGDASSNESCYTPIRIMERINYEDEDNYNRNKKDQPKKNMKDSVKFKYVTASSHVALAIDDTERVFVWGKVLGGTVEDVKIVPCDNMLFVNAGANHFCAIDSKNMSPYTWGSNLFYKCGQNFSDGNSKEGQMNFHSFPRKLDYLFDLFSKSKEDIRAKEEEDKIANKFNNRTINENKFTSNLKQNIEGRYSSRVDPKSEAININIDKTVGKVQREFSEIQIKLLDENPEWKGAGLYGEDLKTNAKFTEVLSDFFINIRALEEERMQETMKVENSILSAINQTSSRKKETYRSDVPKIISQNFQLFEETLNLLQVHPCYLKKAYDSFKNKSAFINMVKMVFGWNSINMKNKRVILMLMGLWNALFKKESEYLQQVDSFEDLITYDLYELIFKINSENSEILYEIIAETLVFFVIKILINVETCEISSLDQYKKITANEKEVIINEVVSLLSQKINKIFNEMKEGYKNNFSYSVIWIFKQLSNLFSEDIEKFGRVLNFFLFVPFVSILDSLSESEEGSYSRESEKLIQKMNEIITNKIKSKSPDSLPEFSQFCNLFKSNGDIVQSYFKNVTQPKSEVLKTVREIFSRLSKSEEIINLNEIHIEQVGLRNKHKQDHISNSMINTHRKTPSIEESLRLMHRECHESLKEYKYDFTFTALREFVKSHCEIGNETISVPLSIENIIQVRECIINMKFDEKESKSDLVRLLKSYIAEFKLEALESDSKIKSQVLNLAIQPNSLFYNINVENSLFKCEDCLLPLHGQFNEKRREISTWTCDCKDKVNELNIIQCVTCGVPKSKSAVKLTKSFFQLFEIPYDDKETLSFEAVLCCLHPVSERDDIMQEITLALDKLTSATLTTEKSRMETLKSFVNLINAKVGRAEDTETAKVQKESRIKTLFKQAKVNYARRSEHVNYLTTINDFLTYLVTSAENAKGSLVNVEHFNAKIQYNVAKGYSDSWAKLNKKAHVEKVDSLNIIKKCLVVALINMKVVDEILFDGQLQPKLTQKSYILFEKEEDGYSIKLNYREKYRRFILCGAETHEVILEDHKLSNARILQLRKNARHNPTLNLGGIRFNVFYLIKLLNSLV